MQHQFNTPRDTAASLADPPYRTNPELILVFTPKGMKCHVFRTNTAEEQGQMERLLSQIEPCLEIANSIIKRKG